MSMVERVARAVHSRNDALCEPQFRVSWEECIPHYREQLLADARAAIEAMRQPPVEMLTAFAQIADEADLAGKKIGWCHPDTWDAMISAALT